MKNIWKVVGLLIILINLSGCLSLDRFSQIVEERIAQSDLMMHDTLKMPGMLKIEYHDTIQSPLFYRGDNYIIPAIIFWSWKNTLICELPYRYKLNAVKYGMYNAWQKDSVKFNDTVLISISHIPGKMVYVDDEMATIFITVSKEVVRMNKDSMLVTYYYGGNKRETIMVVPKFFKSGFISRKMLIDLFLDSYEERMKRVGKDIIYQLDSLPR